MHRMLQPAAAIVCCALLVLAATGEAAASQAAHAVETERVDLRHEPFGPHVPGVSAGEGFDPVDQAVADLDALSHSLRRVDPGAARFPEHVRIYRLRPETPGMWSELGAPEREHARPDQRHGYRYEAPGVRAWLRRPEYLVRGDPNDGRPLVFNRPPQRDGEMLELIPPDTIFDLIPPNRRARHEPAPDPSEAHQHQMDYRIDTRLDTRIDARIDTRVESGSDQSP